MENALRVGIVGAGSWGTTAATVCPNEPLLWARNSDIAAEINQAHTNSKYLPDVVLPPTVRATTSLDELVNKTDLLVMAVPSHGFRGILQQLSLPTNTPIVSLAKGLESGSLARMSQVASEVFPNNPFAVLTGPNLAREIVDGQPTASVVASNDEFVATQVQLAFNSPMFRVYLNDDVVGCEIAGVVKNVIALGVGMADGMGLGHNSRAAMITRGLAEITRLGVALGGHAETFAGLAGMGDLIATCYSTQSRNNTVGRRLGSGENLGDITASMSMVAEGVNSAASVLALARANQVEMPIVEQVVGVCNGAISVREALTNLLSRSVGAE